MYRLQMLSISPSLKFLHFTYNSQLCVNPLPNDKISDWSKLKTKRQINVAEMMISLSHLAANIVGKGENAGNQHFLLFPQCFQKPSFSGSLKVAIKW